MSVYELAKQYYPKLWGKTRIDALYQSGKLTEEEYHSIVGKSEVDEE